MVRRNKKRRWYFCGRNLYQGVLGEIRSIGEGATIPTGWLECNAVNNAAGAVNGITPPDDSDRVTVGVGIEADGVTGGADSHTHSTHPDHDASHAHNYTPSTHSVQNAGANPYTVLEGISVSTTGPFDLPHQAHDTVGNKMKYVVRRRIIFVGV